MPDRPHTNRGAAFETLFEAPLPEGPARGGALPPDLQRYGTRLVVPMRADRPVVLVNFVESLDGVVTLDPEHGSGAEVSGFSEPDRFVMGLLRTAADVIVVGAGTVRAAAKHVWTATHVNRGHAAGYAEWRRQLGLPPEPTTVIVTASGDLPPHHPALASPNVPAIVVATESAVARLRAVLPAQVRVIATPDADHVTAAAILEIARDMGAGVVLCEGGPHLTGTFVAEQRVDELFLTLAPQLVGRPGGTGREQGDSSGRYSLVEGLTLGIDDARWAQLRSVRRSVDHLFLRYAFDVAEA